MVLGEYLHIFYFLKSLWAKRYERDCRVFEALELSIVVGNAVLKLLIVHSVTDHQTFLLKKNFNLYQNNGKCLNGIKTKVKCRCFFSYNVIYFLNKCICYKRQYNSLIWYTHQSLVELSHVGDTRNCCLRIALTVNNKF